MKFLIPLILVLSVASGARLSLLPYAYLSSPIPVYHQYQNTRTGEHAFSYAGGPSAQEQVKDASGVLRGSYSYIDANGILQSAFYVADENGFRVAATNLPSDDNVNAEAAHIILARSANAEENSRSNRRRRSTESDPNLHKTKRSTQENIKEVLLEPVQLADGIPLATSHQSQVQVHKNTRLDLTEVEADAKPVDLQPIQPLQITNTILSGLPVLTRAPTYHENRIELHKDLGIEGPEPKDAVKIDPEPLTIVQSPSIQAIPVASTVVARESLPIVPVVAKQAVPVLPAVQIGTASVTTSISSHGVSQIHGAQEAVAIPSVIAKESTPVALIGTEKNESLTKELPNLATATVTTSISSHGISQIHGSNAKLEPTLLFKTAAPIAHLQPILNVPIHTLYLH
ncbi:uncharacterized protein LOC108623803 [Ceratina calcarata]|uniref:Uncharacterized protein LOC108623803 n=1 Tax=Ceratina calcarata TaxID=156304 RepID=A0AAJ7RZ32_9HYME|nr:uncharacterized protein LOC108623803 [Ceratina calcarata]